MESRVRPEEDKKCFTPSDWNVPKQASVLANMAQAFERCLYGFLNPELDKPSSRNKRNGRLRTTKSETKLSFSKNVYNIRGFSKMVDYKINVLKITVLQYTSHK